jgi:GNAT superfamily N-acetyltransferase
MILSEGDDCGVGAVSGYLEGVRPCKATAVTTVVRLATPEDGVALREIERLAGERFRDVGLEAVADHEPPSLQTLATYALAGRAWVAIDDVGVPVGYVLVDVVDGCAHVEQVSVQPDHQGLGVGRALLDRARSWATEAALNAVTLITFAEVPWNRPLYEHLGFRVLPEAEIGLQLRAVRDAEAAHGLDPLHRVCMRLELAPLPVIATA